MTKTLTIGMFQTGAGRTAWRTAGPDAPDHTDLGYWTGLAQRCEAAGADFLFLADSYGYPVLGDSIVPAAIERDIQFSRVDVQMLVSAMAAATERLGLVTTTSVMTEKPPTVARQYATLDHLTGGRIGWNIVTGSAQAASALLFGEPLMPHDERYALADDHAELTLRFWEGCWEDDALRKDAATGTYADPRKVHEIVHEGPYFRAKGVLTVPPGPQRTPVLFQAGASSKGRELAAEYAEAVFLAAETKALAEQIADIRRRAEAYGREPGAIKFLVAGTFRVAGSRAEAEAQHEEAVAGITLEHAATLYAYYTGLDLLSMDLDRPLPPSAAGTDSGRTNVERFLGEDAPTVRQILEEFRRNSVMGAPFLGDAEEVVDQATATIEETGADGFLVQPGRDGGYGRFFEEVMPEMRRRGLLPERPAGATLRERFFGEGVARLPQTHPGAAFRPANMLV